VSFEVAMKHLGGDTVVLGPGEIGLGGASVGDIACCQLCRDRPRVFDHDTSWNWRLIRSVPVINGLSDGDIPARPSPTS
jgi:ornithine carbamoyltransferase